MKGKKINFESKDVYENSLPSKNVRLSKVDILS